MPSLHAALVLLLSCSNHVSVNMVVSAERPLSASESTSSYAAPTERPSSLSKHKQSQQQQQQQQQPTSKRKKKKNTSSTQQTQQQGRPMQQEPPRNKRGQQQQQQQQQQQNQQCTTPGSCQDTLDDNRNESHAPPSVIQVDDTSFVEYLRTVVDYYTPPELYDGLCETTETASITTPMQRHLERVMVTHQFPDAYPESLRKMGNYSDGTPAGSPQWIGDHGRQNPANPTYATFGSILDISTKYSQAWEGSTEFGGKPSWIASLIQRRAIVREEFHVVPCRVDLLDDYDIVAPYDDDSACFLGVEADEYVSVRGNDEKKYAHWELAAEWGIGEHGYFVNSDIMDLELKDEDDGTKDRKFDTIIANGALASVDAMHDMDLVLEKMVSFLKPGGVIFLVGIEPLVKVDGPGRVFNEILDVIDSVKGLSGVYPHRNVPATWVNRNLHRLGLNVFSSTLFPTEPTFDDMSETVHEATKWIDENETSGAVKKQYKKMLSYYMDKAREVTKDGPVFAGERQYIIAAELPSDNNKDGVFPQPHVVEPTIYQPKPKYEVDTKPKVEKLDETPVAPGKMLEHKWANGDKYDGLGARIGIPPQLVPTITQYVKDLGLWDMMIDIIQNDPMPQDTTKFFNVTSPYGGEGRNFSWSAKRPDNFYGSDSDMHWFDIADEASHEDSIRALAKGGFDEVLNGIGEYLGLDSLTTFSIGLLAVTKADKGYVHVDFDNTGRRAFNLLINLETPGDEPELTVIEEDAMGNFRRGQVKYESNFGVLNGDAGMHATNECNHKASGGVRLTASIFISDLKEGSVAEVAGHDNYYFPFGNEEWIWAQAGRHWKKDGSVSLTSDRGRDPFIPEDHLTHCETRVGKNKEKCWVNGIERKRCYKTCGFFMPDDEFRPGEERLKIFGW